MIERDEADEQMDNKFQSFKAEAASRNDDANSISSRPRSTASNIKSGITKMTALPKKMQLEPIKEELEKIHFANKFYQEGDFISYAMKKQKQQIELNRYVDLVIFEAVQSHLSVKKRINLSNIQIKENSIKNQQKLRNFQSLKDMQDFLKNPFSNFIKKQVIPTLNPDIRILVRKFNYKCQESRDFCFVQGNLIHISSLNLKKYSKTVDNDYIVPFHKYPQVFIKIGADGDKKIFHQIKKNLYSKKQLENFNQAEKQKIITTVCQYLKNKNIQFESQKINEKVGFLFDAENDNQLYEVRSST